MPPSKPTKYAAPLPDAHTVTSVALPKGVSAGTGTTGQTTPQIVTSGMTPGTAPGHGTPHTLAPANAPGIPSATPIRSTSVPRPASTSNSTYTGTSPPSLPESAPSRSTSPRAIQHARSTLGTASESPSPDGQGMAPRNPLEYVDIGHGVTTHQAYRM